MQKNNKFHRRSLRLSHYDYSSEGVYFVTICTHDRKCLFGEIIDGKMAVSKYGIIAQECWNSMPTHFSNTELDEYAVMPNHIHGIINIGEPHHVGARHAVPLRD